MEGPLVSLWSTSNHSHTSLTKMRLFLSAFFIATAADCTRRVNECDCDVCRPTLYTQGCSRYNINSEVWSRTQTQSIQFTLYLSICLSVFSTDCKDLETQFCVFRLLYFMHWDMLVLGCVVERIKLIHGYYSWFDVDRLLLASAIPASSPTFTHPKTNRA